MSDGGQYYTGNADPGDAGSRFTGIDFAIQQALARINTAALVKIVKAPYDAEGNPIAPGTPGPVGFVDVQPLVNQLDGQGNATPHGTVYRLSYHRYQSGAGAIISDPMVGDIGKMMVASRDGSVVKATNAQGNPGSRRKFNMADGTFFGCTQAGAPGQYFAWTATGFRIADKNGNTLVGDADGIRVNGILFARGPNGTFRGHTHAQDPDSHGDTEVETNPPTAGT